jgi:lipoyl(octanoyl) transferase
VISTAMRVPVTHDLAARDGVVVGEDLDHIGLRRLELDDGAAAHAQQHVDRHPVAPEHDREVDRHVVETRHAAPEPRCFGYAAAWARQGEALVTIRDDFEAALLPEAGGAPVEWSIAEGLVPYAEAVAAMEARVEAIAAGAAPERVWLLEHPPLYTAGTSARDEGLAEPQRFPVFRSGRGGQFTYHGPGQRVAYVMLDLNRRRPDLRRYVAVLEAWLIATLAEFNVRGERREDRVGVWVRRPDRGRDAEDKIAAIGIRVRRWVAFHGVSINVAPSLSHFSGINACGITDQGVTSLSDLGKFFSLDEVDQALAATFPNHFGLTAELESISCPTQAASNPKDLTL